MLKYLLLLIILLPSVSALNAFVDGNLLIIDGEGQYYNEEISIYYKGTDPSELAGSVNLGCDKCKGINNFDLIEFDLALDKDYYFYVCDYEDKTNCERFEFDFGQIAGEGCDEDGDCIPGLHCVGPGPNYGCCDLDEECYFNGECYDVGEFTSNKEYVCSSLNEFKTCNNYCKSLGKICIKGGCIGEKQKSCEENKGFCSSVIINPKDGGTAMGGICSGIKRYCIQCLPGYEKDVKEDKCVKENNDCVVPYIDHSLLVLNQECASTNFRPQFCNDGNIIDNCQICGCTPYKSCQVDGSCISLCEDGTLNGICSLEKPLYCDEFTLRYNCNVCGCSYNEVCQGSGYCSQGDGPLLEHFSGIRKVNVRGFSYEIRADLQDNDGINSENVKAIIYNNKESYQIDLHYLKGGETVGVFIANWDFTPTRGNEFKVDIYAEDLLGNSALIKNVFSFKLIEKTEFSCNNILDNGKNKINIVLISDEIETVEEFENSVLRKIDLYGQNKGLFSVEPFKSNKNKFSVYSIYSRFFFRCIQAFPQDWPYYLENENLGCDPDFIKNLAKNVCNLKDVDQLNIVSGNNPPWGRAYADATGDFATSSILIPPSEFVHEFGHSFGDLSDEYFTEVDHTYLPISNLNSVNIDIEGCPKWCSGELDINAVCYPYYMDWKECVKNLSPTGDVDKWIQCWNNEYNRLLNKKVELLNKKGLKLNIKGGLKLDECNLGKDCKIGTGCFFTAHGVNGWRQMKNTIMRNPDELPFIFGPISEEAIINIINEKTNEEKISKTCEEAGYICGELHGSGPVVSCLNKNLVYVGDSNLDLSCDSSGMAGCCKIKEEIPIKNEKNSKAYTDKEIFLISDDNWRNVLQLVSLTTWTGDEDWCQRGYGTPENVCVYPTLIYHEEKADKFKISNSIFGVGCPITMGCNRDIDVYLQEKELSIGESANFLLKVTNNGKEIQEFHLFSWHGDLLTVESKELNVHYWSKYYLDIKDITDTDTNYKGISLKPGETKDYRLYITLKKGLDGFDADSIIYFMQQYNPEKVTIVGQTPQELDDFLIAQPELGAGLKQENIQRISTKDYLSYWKEFKDVVYVEDNYELALLASTYASLINAPLIIKESSLDISSTFAGRNIICVGNVNPSEVSCSESYNLEQLQRKYVEITNTDKIILVNPNDLDIKVEEQFDPEKEAKPIYELYSKTSLAAPILASAKHELVLSITSTNYQDVDTFIENKISYLHFDPEYLTIIASPNTIEMSKESAITREEVDNHLYGNIDSDPFQELAVGRIFSLTSSDISSYIARDLFYSEIPKDNDFSLMWQPPVHSGGWGKAMFIAIEDIFENMGLNSISFITDQYIPSPKGVLEFKNKFILMYEGHANFFGGGDYDFTTGWLKDYKIWLNSPLVFTVGCSTCAFEKAALSLNGNNLFCANLLRHGAIFHYGATVDDTATNGDFNKMGVEELLISENIGQATKNVRNKLSAYSIMINKDLPLKFLQAEFDQFNILIGDPIFSPNLQKPELNELTVSLNRIDELNYYINIEVPEQNKNIKINYEIGEYIAKPEFMYYIKMFNYPFGNNILRMFKGDSTQYNLNDRTSFNSPFQNDFLTFSLNIPKGYSIKQIKDVEYIDQNITKSIKNIPIFESEYYRSYPNVKDFDYIHYVKDEGSENTYYFVMKILYGGNPLIIQNQKIPEHRFKIYLELGGESS